MTTKVDMQYLSDEYMAEYNEEKRDWYTKFVNNYRTEIRHQIEWRDYVRENNVYITFFTWYELFYMPQDIENPFLKTYQTPKITNTYKQIKENKKVDSIHPPKVAVQVEDKYIANPLVNIDVIKASCQNIESLKIDMTKEIIYQNNYSNEILNTMSQQLNRIENCQNKVKEESTLPKKILDKPESKPLFIPQHISDNVNLGYNPKLVKELTEKLTGEMSNLRINMVYKNIGSSSEEDTNISDVEQQFINTTGNVNRFKFKGNTASTSRPDTYNYYPRPTFPDIQYEDRDSALNRSNYDGTSVYEWNIDGYSEHQILNLLT